MSARRLAVVVLLLLAAHATHAFAEVAVTTSLDEADRRYAELDYRGAAELAQSAAQEPTASPADRVRGWERVGLCWLVLGQHRLAHEALDKLFTLDPKHEVVDPSLSPRQREFIDEVRAKHPVAPPAPPPPTVSTVVTAPPPTTTPPPPVQRPVWKRWYVWTPIAIGVVAGVGLGVGLGLGLRHDGPSGSLGTVGLGLRF